MTRKEKEEALLYAAESGDLENAKVLLHKGANANARNWYGRTPLMYAARDGHTDLVNLLLDNGARVNLRGDRGWTAILFAAPAGHADIVKKLQERGADVNSEADDGMTALMLAAYRGHIDIVKMLLDAGANPNAIAAKGLTALALAADFGQTAAVRVLLDASANPDFRNNSGHTALDKAIRRGHTETALLIARAMQGNDQAIQVKEQPEFQETSEGDDGFSIREANKDDLPGIAALLSGSKTGAKTLDWAQWKFRANPGGPSWLYIAVDASDTIIGLSARISRMFASSRTGEFRMGQNVDMFLAEEYRKKGVYRRITQLAGEKRDYLMIGITNENSWVHLKNDLDIILPVETWHFPVTISKLIAEKPYGSIVPFSGLFSWLYSLFWLGPRPHNLQMVQLERFERDFDFDPEVIHGVRTADYLNWRFIYNPISSYSIYGFFEGEQIVGYCVYKEVNAIASIYDFITIRRQRGCLRLFVDHCREIGISSLQYKGVGLSLARLGFVRHGSIGQCILSDIKDGRRVPQGRWLITLADKD